VHVLGSVVGFVLHANNSGFLVTLTVMLAIIFYKKHALENVTWIAQTATEWF